jgi:hypothetical protein
MFTDTKAVWLFCPKCEDIYRTTPSSDLERLTVNPAVDLSAYPEVVVYPEPPYCDCRLREYLQTMCIDLGPSYCPRHNVISIGGLYEQQDLKNIDQTTINVIVHETLHWVLGKTYSEKASYWLDEDNVSNFLETFTLCGSEE